MDFKDKLREQLNREDLTDVESKVNAIAEAVGDFIPKGKYNEVSTRLHNLESEKNAIQSQLDNERKQKLSIEEQNSQKIQEILEKAEARERQAAIRENSAEATEILIGAGLSKEDIANNNLLAFVTDNKEDSIARANSLASIFKSQKVKVEEQVKKEYFNNNPTPPASNNQTGGDVMTKEKFDKLSYSEMIKFQQENPQLFAEFSKK